ncbi:MAG: hypothetical protein [Olavius algarvensis Delta 4 endosymbiont]|nr:MAG: hypothetical protein [Olavius algarvensis Delta 4 endosymbiont]
MTYLLERYITRLGGHYLVLRDQVEISTEYLRVFDRDFVLSEKQLMIGSPELF